MPQLHEPIRTALALSQALQPLATQAGADPDAMGEACAMADLLRVRLDRINGDAADAEHPAADRLAQAWAVAACLARDLPAAGSDVDAQARAAVLAGLVPELLSQAVTLAAVSDASPRPSASAQS
ncbi:MAG: hypothetical protein RL722_528 [Pseudomonadota bacterium]|jgi:hypothetical protein